MPRNFKSGRPIIKQITEQEIACHSCSKTFNVMKYVMFCHERCYHCKCFKKSSCRFNLRFWIAKCSAHIKGLDDVPEAQKDEIIKILLPKVMPRSLRAQLQLTKCIDEMDVGEW